MIALITEWKDADGSIQQRDAQSDLGGTMRLGAQSSDVAKGTLAHQIYGDVVTERHRHRYEFNSERYGDAFEKNGMQIAGTNPERGLTEILELKNHPFYIGVQFHPEFLSKPTAPHPLFAGFVGAALKAQTKGKTPSPIPLVKA